MGKKVWEIGKIKEVELKNKFLRSAIWEGLATEDGYVTEELLTMYRRLAEGGVGGIITGYAQIIDFDRPAPRMLSIKDDSYIEGLNKLVEVAHKEGAKIFLQIAVGGSQGSFSKRYVAPSSHVHPVNKNEAHGLSVEEIKEIVKSFGEAGKRAKEAGFDGVQIHGAHGYLLSQFMNPIFNKREDSYGGSIEGRAKIVFEVYEELRSVLGEDYPILIKINCEDFVEGGANQEDMLWVCKELDRRGIDLIEVSGGSVVSTNNLGVIRTKINKREDEAYFEEFATKLSDEVKCPISIVGGIRSLDKAEELLEETNISFISLARTLLAEPDLILDWKRGREEKAFCKSCNGCLGNPKGTLCKLKKQEIVLFENSKTRENLLQAFRGELSGVVLYSELEKLANEEEKKLFKTLKRQEGTHGRLFKKYLGKEAKGLTKDEKLALAESLPPFRDALGMFAAGEKKAGEEGYPNFAKIAKEEGFDRISKLFLDLAKIELRHSRLLEELL